MLRIATDPRCSMSLASIRDELTITDLLDLDDALDLRDDVEAEK